MLVPRSNPAGPENESACRNQRGRPIPLRARLRSDTAGIPDPHHRTPGKALPRMRSPPGPFRRKVAAPKPVTASFPLAAPRHPPTDGAGKTPEAVRLPHLTASTPAEPSQDPRSGPGQPELPRTVRAAGKPRTTGKRKTDRPQRAVRSSIRHAAVRTLSGAKSSVRNSDTRNRRKVPD